MAGGSMKIEFVPNPGDPKETVNIESQSIAYLQEPGEERAEFFIRRATRECLRGLKSATEITAPDTNAVLPWITGGAPKSVDLTLITAGKGGKICRYDLGEKHVALGSSALIIKGVAAAVLAIFNNHPTKSSLDIKLIFKPYDPSSTPPVV